MMQERSPWGRLWTLPLLAATIAMCATGSLDAAERRVEVEPGVARGTHNRWPDALYMESDRQVMAVVLPAVGGRVVHYSFAGDNILFEMPGSDGKTLAQAKGPFPMGGHYTDIDLAAGATTPDRTELLLGPYTSEVPDDYTVTVRSPRHAALGVQLERELVMDPESGEIGLAQRVQNISDRELVCRLHDRTPCRTGGYAIVPLRKDSRYKLGWARQRTVDGREIFDGDNPTSDRVEVKGGVLVARAGGEATRLAVDSNAGWVAYVRGRLLLVKFHQTGGAGVASSPGIELYFDQQFTELDVVSPEQRLAPGARYEMPGKWVLMQLKREVTSFEDARVLAKRVPPSPFTNR